jgi:hypothetical protein
VLDWVIPMDRLLSSFPAVRVTDEGRVWVGHGRELTAEQYEQCEGPASGDWIRLFDSSGHLLAVATPGSSPGSLHPTVVLN